MCVICGEGWLIMRVEQNGSISEDIYEVEITT